MEIIIRKFIFHSDDHQIKQNKDPFLLRNYVDEGRLSMREMGIILRCKMVTFLLTFILKANAMTYIPYFLDLPVTAATVLIIEIFNTSSNIS